MLISLKISPEKNPGEVDKDLFKRHLSQNIRTFDD